MRTATYVFDCLGQYSKAVEVHTKDLNVSREFGDRAGEGQAYGDLVLRSIALVNTTWS